MIRNTTSFTPEERKQQNQALVELHAAERDRWIEKNIFFHQYHWSFLRHLIPEGLRVLALGCGTGRILEQLRPARGVGVDASQAMIETARRNYPGFAFHVADVEDADAMLAINEVFDIILLSDTIGYLDDCESTLSLLHRFCIPSTRLVVAYFNPAWGPLLRYGEKTGLRMPHGELNWLSAKDIEGLLILSDFELIARTQSQLLPKRAFGLGTLLNRFLAPLPAIRNLCLLHYAVARSKLAPNPDEPSVSIIVPCRNEKGNIESAVTRLPPFCKNIELIFVEGHSSDGTWEECLRVQAAFPQRDIQCHRQDGKGKGDAVRKGFSVAKGDILMILDADLTVRPEDLPKFYRVISSGKAEFVNGTRMVYPMQSDAMQHLNYFANWTFAAIFSYLLNQRFTDTLCGTKVLRRHDYERIAANRHYFGDFDPFGDFDLIFGAARLGLKISEVPVRYMNRSYGSTQISRFRHGWLLLRMVVFAFFKMKAMKIG